MFALSPGTIPTCFNEPLTLPCKAIQRVDGIIDVEWKARNINSKSEPWIRFAYCNKFMVCVVTKPRLPNGIEVVNISDAGSLTIQGSAKNSPNSQAQLKCEVHYSDNSKNHRAHQINFTVCKFHCTAFTSHVYMCKAWISQQVCWRRDGDWIGRKQEAKR